MNRYTVKHYIKGDKVGFFTFLEEAGFKIDPKYGKKRRIAKFKCECGKELITTVSPIARGIIKSCGCYTLKRIQESNVKHGLNKHPLYGQWQNIKNRCNNPNIRGYNDYGGRGIIVCEEWTSEFLPFYNWAMENNWEWGLSVDRINNDGNYEPSNCRLATSKEQSRNTRRTIRVNYEGKEYCLLDLCEKLNVSYASVRKRLKDYKWTLEKALSTETKTDKINRLHDRQYQQY